MEQLLATLIHDTSFWVAVSFTIFVVLAWWKGRKAIAKMIDNNIDNIKHEIHVVEKMKREAEEIYQEAQKKLQSAEQLAGDIIKASQEDGEKLMKQADEKLQRQLMQKEKQLLERIEQDKNKLKHQFAKEIAKEAIMLAEKQIAEELKMPDKAKAMTERAIKNIKDSSLTDSLSG